MAQVGIARRNESRFSLDLDNIEHSVSHIREIHPGRGAHLGMVLR